MKSSITKDILNLKSTDRKVSEQAYLNLVRKKTEAVPFLLKLLEAKRERGRALAAEALANIADCSVADVMFNFLEDKDERVRSWSAVTLRRIGDPRALQALLKTINDTPDELHGDQTISTYALIQWGPEILLQVIGLLNASEFQTRFHAFEVVKKIVFNHLQTKEKWESAWKDNGSYHPLLEPEQRIECAESWKKWVKKYLPE